MDTFDRIKGLIELDDTKPCVMHNYGPWMAPAKDGTTNTMYKLGLHVRSVSVCSRCGAERYIVEKA